MTPLTGAPVSLLVPAYAHPAVAPGLWRRLVELAPVLRAVVVNPASGPGEWPDPGYPPVLAPLREAGIRLLGYVDTGYGRRPGDLIEVELAAYREFYGIRDVFFDQVATGADVLDHYQRVVRRARGAGARFVVLNHGAHPHPGYLGSADLAVTFEGTWADYRLLDPPPWVRAVPPGRLCHLVHGLPRGAGAGAAFAELVGRAAAAGVTTLFGSDGWGDNPWDTLPESLVRDLVAEPAEHG